MGGDFVIGVDGGTNSLRVGVFTLDGRPVVIREHEYETYFPQPGWAEQHPHAWWEAMKTATPAALAAAGLQAPDIAGICVDATSCTVVMLDGQYRPLRPALLWMDVRASDQARRMAATGHDALKYNGFGNVSAEWLPCKALWVKENEPDIYRQAKYVCEYIDWMNWKLTGNLAASLNNASIRWYYDNARGGWPVSFYEQIGLGEILERFPRTVLPMEAQVGTLTREAAAELGLREGTVVAEGGADAFVGMVGLNVVRPGRMALITGSSHLQLGLSSNEFHTRGLFGTYADAVIRGLHAVEGGQISTGSVLKWFRDNFLQGERIEAERRGEGVYDVLNKRAASLAPGSEGLIVLDHWQGNRTPYTDPESRGVIWGLTLRHQAHHVYRAIMEGVAYGTQLIFDTMRQQGLDVTEVYACGGPTQSDLWMQIHANVTNVPIHLTAVPAAPMLGGAILAAVASAKYPSVQKAADAMVQVTRRIEPDPLVHREYRFYYEKYVDTYECLSDLLHEVVRHQAQRA